MVTKTAKPAIPTPGANVYPFKLGDRVKDTLNDLEGIATSRFYHMTGCDRFGLELDAKDGKPGEFYHVSAERLELVKAYPERHRNEVPDIHIKLGDKVKSIHQGVAGTCCIIHVPLYGSIQADIAPDWDDKKRVLPEGYFVDVAFVEVTEPYDARPAAETKPKPGKKVEPGCSRMSIGATQR